MTTANEPTEKTCPFCAETIKAAAVVCRFCGRDLPKEGAATQEKPAGDWFARGETPPDAGNFQARPIAPPPPQPIVVNQSGTGAGGIAGGIVLGCFGIVAIILLGAGLLIAGVYSSYSSSP